MKTISTLRLFVLSTTCLIPFSTAIAQEGDFGLSDEPVEKPVPIYDNYVEGGFSLATERADHLGRFNGREDDGIVPLGSFNLLQRAPRDGTDTWFVRGSGENLGLESRTVGIEGGEQGLWKLRGNYAELPFTRFGNALTAHQGVGSGNLTLVPGWTTGANLGALTTNGSIARRAPLDIRTDRTRTGIGLTWNIDQAYTLAVKTQHERKEGLKPLGMAFGTGGGSPAALIPEPVDYETDQAEVQLGFANRQYQWRVGYQVQRFENDIESVTATNPFNTAAPFNRGRMALAPDNFAHSINLDGGYNFSEMTRLTSNFSYGQYLQDEKFLPYSLNANTALPRASLDGKIENTTGNVELTHRFDKTWDIKTRYRYTDRDNDTPVATYRYYIDDNSAQIPAANARNNNPYSFREHLITNDLGYQLMPSTKITGGYDFRIFDRTLSEREHQYDNTARLGARSTLADGIVANAKYARLWRTGSSYDWRAPLRNSFQPNFAPTDGLDNHPLLRKFDKASLERDTISGGLTYQATDALSLGLAGSLNRDDYTKSVAGLTDAYGYSTTLDAAYTFNELFTLSSFYSYDRRDTDQIGWTFSNANQANDFSRRWKVTTEDDVHTTGLTGEVKPMQDLRLFVDYVYTDARTRFNNSTFGGAGLTTPAPLEEVHYRSHGIGLRAQYDLTDQIELGLGYMFERLRSNDWQIDKAQTATTSTLLTLNEDSPDEDRHLILMTTRYKF